MKKVIAILFILLLAFKLVGFIAVFKFRQHVITEKIKLEIKQGVLEDELSIITVTEENKHLLKWKNKREFFYKGNMYDVVRKRKSNIKTILYYCINDEKEAILLAKLDMLVKNSMDQNSKKNNVLQYNAPFLVLDKIQHCFFGNNLISNTVAISLKYIKNYTSPYLSIVGPPPKLTLKFFQIVQFFLTRGYDINRNSPC